ncbi:MAG TPA: DUF4112 domain-containing protein [Allosphingosinicella sp.]|nr:DUF4112 domain-containing protein [Allosphingosinicella sp.]
MPSQEQFDALAERLPVGRDPASVRRRIEAMEKLLERMFTLPGTNRQFGLDVVFDLIPVGGSLVAAAMGSWLAWEARNLGMPKWHLARMGGNIGVDFLLGAIPFVGAIPDFFFKSNTRNLRIVKRWLDKNHPETMIVEGEVVARNLPPHA